MTRLRFELDIDGEVYPELHAVLSALGSETSRGERLRQLAASGLVWELMRRRELAIAPSGPMPTAAAAMPTAVHAPATVHAPVAVAAPAAVPVPAAAAVHLPAPVHAAMPAPAAAPVATPVATPVAAPLPAPPSPAPRPPAPTIVRHATRAAGDFVDLALNAEPPLARPRPVERTAHEPPVLVDVVEAPFAQPAPPPHAEPPHAEPPHAEPHELETAAPLDQRPSTRARLLHLKEMGLFKNG